MDEDIRILDERKKHWNDIFEEIINDKGEIHALRQEVYMKEKEELINIELLVEVPHQKGRKIVWNCMEDNIIEEKKDNREIELRGFDYILFE